MNKITFFLFLMLSASVYAQESIKIAYVGNNITYDYLLLPDRKKNCYPAQLRSLLGDRYEVINFRKSETTLLSKGHPPYIKEQEYKDALYYSEKAKVNNMKLPASIFRTQKSNKVIMEIERKSLPDYPVEGGVSGVFIGVHNNRLIVAGGCNFPNKPTSEGGEKVFYKDVYLLDISKNTNQEQWIKCTPFPHEVAYGASVNTSEGIVCIGGQNKKTALADVVLIQYNEKNNNVVYTQLPSLPVSHFNGSAAVLDGVIYVAGGKFSDKEAIYSLNLKDIKSNWSKIDFPSEYERQQPVLVVQSGNLLLAGGYDEQIPKVFTDVLRFDFETNSWQKYVNIYPEDIDLKTFVGASGFAYEKDNVLFAGGVNYDRFDSALKRIKKTQQAVNDNDSEQIAVLKAAGKEYMNQTPEWYKFNKTLSILNLQDQSWHSIGDYEQLARAGAGITLWNNRLYIVCGELKPGVRTVESSCLILR